MDIRRYSVRIAVLMMAGVLCTGTLSAQAPNSERQMTVIFEDDFSVSQTLKQVTENVQHESDGRQVPWFSSNIEE